MHACWPCETVADQIYWCFLSCNWTNMPACCTNIWHQCDFRNIQYTTSVVALTYNLQGNISNQELRQCCKGITQHRPSIVITTYCSSEGGGETVSLRSLESSTEQGSTGKLGWSNWMREATDFRINFPDGRSKALRICHRTSEGHFCARTHRRWRCEVTADGSNTWKELRAVLCGAK